MSQKVRYLSLRLHDQAESRAIRRGFLVSGKAKRSFKLWKKLKKCNAIALLLSIYRTGVIRDHVNNLSDLPAGRQAPQTLIINRL